MLAERLEDDIVKAATSGWKDRSYSWDAEADYYLDRLSDHHRNRAARGVDEKVAVWEAQGKESELLVEADGVLKLARRPMMFSLSLNIELTYGDLIPYLGVAISVAKRGAPVVVALEMTEQLAAMTWGRALKLVSNQLGDPLTKAEWSAGEASEGPALLRKAVNSVPPADRRNISYAAWLPSVSSVESTQTQGFMLLFVADANKYGVHADLGREIRGLAAPRDPAVPVIWVTNGLSLHKEGYALCTQAHVGERDTEFLDVRPDHIEMSLNTGDTGLFPGEMIFNVRSRILFPPDGKYLPMPHPLGMIMLKFQKAAMDESMKAWFAEVNSAALTIVCFALGSFVDKTAQFAAVLERLTSFTELRILAQVPPLKPREEPPAWWPGAPHHVHVGFMANLAVFPLCDVIVHTGGAGTTAEAAYFGKPQMMMYEPMGYDKPNNAAQIGKLCNDARLCSRALPAVNDPKANATQLCAGLKSLGGDGSTVADLVTSAIRRAAMEQKETAAQKQRIIRDEMGDMSENDSNALRIVSEEMHKVWTRAPHVSHTGMPVLIYKSGHIAAAELAAFALALANKTNAVLAFIGAGKEEWSSLTADHAIPAHLLRFEDTQSALQALEKTMPLGNFSKYATLVCEPFAAAYGEIRRELVYDFVYDASCEEHWSSHMWKNATLKPYEVTWHMSAMRLVGQILGLKTFNTSTDSVLMYKDGMDATLFARLALTLARAVQQKVVVVLDSALDESDWKRALHRVLEMEAKQEGFRGEASYKAAMIPASWRYAVQLQSIAEVPSRLQTYASTTLQGKFGNETLWVLGCESLASNRGTWASFGGPKAVAWNRSCPKIPERESFISILPAMSKFESRLKEFINAAKGFYTTRV